MSESSPPMPVLFISHGAATLTLNPTDPTNLWLRAYGDELRALRPRAVLVCSGHDVRTTSFPSSSPPAPPATTSG